MNEVRTSTVVIKSTWYFSTYKVELCIFYNVPGILTTVILRSRSYVLKVELIKDQCFLPTNASYQSSRLCVLQTGRRPGWKFHHNNIPLLMLCASCRPWVFTCRRCKPFLCHQTNSNRNWSELVKDTRKNEGTRKWRRVVIDKYG